MINRNLILVLGLSFTMVAFQNCSQADFSPSESVVESVTPQDSTNDSTENQLDTDNNRTDSINPGGGVNINGNGGENSTGANGNVSVTLPTIGDYASIAFEDNVNSPNAGDRDYNDAVFNYKIEEKYNNSKQLERIDIEVRVREKIAGNNHRLYLYFNGNTGSAFSNITHVSAPAFQGLADIMVTDPDGQVESLSAVDSLVVVPATAGAKGDTYKFVITLNSPGQNQVSMVPEFIDFRKYRFILQNHGSNAGIDISEINSTDEMLANDGYPLGFMIPTNWDPPREGQLIDNKYPNFSLYRAWLNGDQTTLPSGDALTWFFSVD